MPDFRVADTAAFDSKFIEAGNAAIGLWTRAGSWAMQHLTDGFVPSGIARQLGSKANANRLINAGLWVEVNDGFRFITWEKHQRSKEQVEAEKTAARERMRRVRSGERSANVQGTFGGSSGVRSDSVRDSLPFPSLPEPKGSIKSAAGERGSRLPEDFRPRDDVMKSLGLEHPDYDLEMELLKFRDYWLAESGAKATKRDWDRAFRTWVRGARSPAKKSSKDAGVGW